MKKNLRTLVVSSSLLASTLAPAVYAAPYQFGNPFVARESLPGEYQVPDASVPEGLTQPKASLDRRLTLTGDWGGLRNDLLNHGLAITPIYSGEVFGNPSGGIKRGAIYDGLLNIAFDVDLSRLTPWSEGGLIHANVLYIHGDSLSGKYVGDFSGTSNIAGYNSPKLQELWYQQQFWQQRISLKVGLIAADTDFFTSDNSALFLNGTFGAFTFVGANLPNAPVYPIAAPGVRLFIQPVSKFYFQAGVFAGDPGSPDENKNGLDWRIRGKDGALVLLESGYLYNQSPGDRGLEGTYKLGAFIHTGEFDTWDSQARNALSGARLTNGGSNYGFYAVADQELYKSGGLTIGGFVRGGIGPSDVNYVDRYLDCGLNFTGLLPGRVNDVAGVAFARSWVSGDFSRADQLQGNPASDAESVVEVTYQISVAPWCTVQPDLQYIINPGANSQCSDAWVMGCRFTVLF